MPASRLIERRNGKTDDLHLQHTLARIAINEGNTSPLIESVFVMEQNEQDLEKKWVQTTL